MFEIDIVVDEDEFSENILPLRFYAHLITFA